MKKRTVPTLTAKEAAFELDLSVSTIRKWASSGKIKAVRLGRQFRFSPSAILDLLPR